MRIAFVTSHPIQYQIPVFRDLAARGGVDLTVLFAQIPDEQTQGDGFGVPFEWDVPLLDGYPYEVLVNVAKEPSVTKHAGCDTPGILEIVRTRRFDAVVVNGWGLRTSRQTLWACRRNGVPCLIRGESNHFTQRPWWKRAAQRWLVNRYSAALYIGEANRRFYATYGVPDLRLFPCLYCVDNQRFREAATAQRRRESRRRWRIDDDVVCFAFTGKFIAKKHPLELLNAFREMIGRGRRAHLLMVGDGELRDRCEEFVRRHALPVTFTGFLNQSRMVDAYSACDCLVLPSDAGETWGLVVNEAMACGRAAIVSRQVGCCEDLIREGVTGASFPFGDWTALSGILNRLAGDPEGLHRMGTAAAAHIDVYSPRQAANGIEAAARFAIGERARISPVWRRTPDFTRSPTIGR